MKDGKTTTGNCRWQMELQQVVNAPDNQMKFSPYDALQHGQAKDASGGLGKTFEKVFLKNPFKTFSDCP